MNLTEMVKLKEAEFGTQDSDSDKQFKLYTLDANGGGLAIKEVDYFSEQAKEILSSRGGVSNKKPEVSVEEQTMNEFLKDLDGRDTENGPKNKNIENVEGDDDQPQAKGQFVKNSRAMLYGNGDSDEDSSDDDANECDFR